MRSEPSFHGDSVVDLRKCPICDDPGWQLVIDDPPHQVRRCDTCGVAYVTPRLADDALAGVYDESYWESTSPKDRGYANYVDDARLYLATFDRRARLIDDRLPAPGRLVDVGCAAGFFLEIMAGRGWDVTGVEPSDAIAATAATRIGEDRVVNATLDGAGLDDGSFDLVTMWDVVEHVPDPVALLAQARRLLAPGGLLVIETQNLDSRFARMLGKRWHHYKHLEHLYHFSPSSIVEVLDRAGLRVVDRTTKFAGKRISLGFARERAGRLHPMLTTLTRPIAGLDNRSFYVNFLDEMIVFAEPV